MVIYFVIGNIFFGLVNIHLVTNLDSSVGVDNNLSSPSLGGVLETSGRNKNDAINNPNKNATHNRVLEYFRQVGMEELDDESIKRLPTWSQIETLIGEKPVFLGLERCSDFRDNVPALRRMLGSAGMFNSGTNLVTRLMKENCVIPERYIEHGPRASKESYGIRWQTPWGKHTPANLKYNHTAPKNENLTKDDMLPIVTIRNPFDWMESMCSHPYTAKWDMHENGTQGKICPHLVYVKSASEKKVPVELTARLAEQDLSYGSLAHLWNEWYAQYWKDADYPFLLVRLEDLVLRQYNTTKILCNCAGGVVPLEDKFKYIVKSAKQGPGHGKQQDRTGMIDAWMKFSEPMKVKAGFSTMDWEAALALLSRELMEKMNYKYPPSS